MHHRTSINTFLSDRFGPVAADALDHVSYNPIYENARYTVLIDAGSRKNKQSWTIYVTARNKQHVCDLGKRIAKEMFRIKNLKSSIAFLTT